MEEIESLSIGETPNDLIQGVETKSNSRLFSTNIQQTSQDTSILDSISAFLGMGSGGESVDLASFENIIGVLKYFLENGERPPTTLISNNPTLNGPSFRSQKYFGEMMNYVIAVDQPLKTKVAVFPSPVNGSGSMFDGFNTSSLYSGLTTINDIVTATMSKGISNTSFMQSHIDNSLVKVTSLLNVTGNTAVDLTRADDAIPLASSLSAAISNRDESPFTIDNFKNGWMFYKGIFG